MNDSHDIRKNLRFRNAELAQEHPEGSTNEWGYLKIKPQNKIKIVDANDCSSIGRWKLAHTCCNNTSVFIQLLRDIRADQSVQGLPQRESVQLSYWR
jgi:hypothetical protein